MAISWRPGDTIEKSNWFVYNEITMDLLNKIPTTFFSVGILFTKHNGFSGRVSTLEILFTRTDREVYESQKKEQDRVRSGLCTRCLHKKDRSDQNWSKAWTGINPIITCQFSAQYCNQSDPIQDAFRSHPWAIYHLPAINRIISEIFRGLVYFLPITIQTSTGFCPRKNLSTSTFRLSAAWYPRFSRGLAYWLYYQTKLYRNLSEIWYWSCLQGILLSNKLIQDFVRDNVVYFIRYIE